MSEKELAEALDPSEWEDMQIVAEVAGFESYQNESSMRDRINELAQYVRRMSGEIWRLRMTYGEKVWHPVNMSDEDMEKERK